VAENGRRLNFRAEEFSNVRIARRGVVPVGNYRLRALSNITTLPSNSNSPTANYTVLKVPSAMTAATMLMISPTTSIAMPHVASTSYPTITAQRRPNMK
jgi:hypothetical protein